MVKYICIDFIHLDFIIKNVIIFIFNDHRLTWTQMFHSMFKEIFSFPRKKV